jgi:hypothetical protein
VLYCMNHTISPIYCGYFGDGISQTICLGWTWTTILPIFACQVARIVEVSYLHSSHPHLLRENSSLVRNGHSIWM